MIEKLGKYHILEEIGRGGMGAVYKAHDPLLKRVVALKVISQNMELTDELRARFFREAQACAKLSHPNIITIYDLGEEQGHLFIVMEYLEGDELRRVIAQRRPSHLEDKLAVMMQVCDGLAYAHQKGIVHRDVKPGNVFILRNGTVKVLDFGVARIAWAEEDLTRPGLIMGTLRYMSPEQAAGTVDHRSDIFSAGAVFYELAAYHPPVAGENPMSILAELHSRTSPSLFRPDPAIPDDLAAVIERALRKNPDERFQHMAEMQAALEAVRGRLSEEATALRRRLASRAAEMRELQVRLVEEAGGESTYDAPPATERRMAVAALEALGGEYDRKLARLREQIERANALRPRYEQAMEHLRLEQWNAAVEILERIVAEMPDHERAQEALTRARAEAERAAEAARREQEAATLSQQVMEELRQRVEPAASAGIDESWSAGEANRAAGLTAFAEQSYASARSRFEAAAEQYRMAAAVIDRRVSDLLSDARRILDGRRFAECLPLVDDVLALSPAQEEAVGLKRAAQQGLAAEAERRAAIEQQCEVGSERLAAGDFAAAIEALTRVIEQEPEHSRARQLLGEAQQRAAEETQRRAVEEAQRRAAAAEAQRLAAEEAQRLAAEEAQRRAAAEALDVTQVLTVGPEGDGTAVLDQPRPGDDLTVVTAEPAMAMAEPAIPEPAPPELEPVAPPVMPEPTSPAVTTPTAPSVTVASEVTDAALPQDAAPSLTEATKVPAATPFFLTRIRGKALAWAVVAAVVLCLLAYWVATPFMGSGRLQAEIQEMRKQVQATREQAMSAEANVLARDLFESAAAKERDAERLTGERRFRESKILLSEAARGYEDAGRASTLSRQVRTRADEARARMLAEKGKAAPAAPDFSQAVAREKEGDVRYRNLAFGEATESFTAAAQLFAAAKPSSPPPAAPSDAQREIREVLRLYSRVFEAKDLNLLQQIRPGIRPDELSRHRDVFEQTRSYRLNLKVDTIKVSGDDADARGRREDVVVTSNGETLRSAGEFVFRLKRANNRWTIDAVR